MVNGSGPMMRVVGDICIPTVVLYPSEPDVNGAARPATIGAVSIVYYLSWATPYVACIVVVCTAEHATEWETGHMKVRLSSSSVVRGPQNVTSTTIRRAIVILLKGAKIFLVWKRPMRKASNFSKT